MDERALIVNADDFGLTPGVNAGIARAHEEGILTSASLMVRWPAAEAAAAYAMRNPRLAVGLHADLGEWHFDEGEWQQTYDVVDLEDPDAVEAEIRGQLAAFRQIMGREPTHIDSHQHVHTHEPWPHFVRLAEELGVPLRGHGERIRNVSFYGRTQRGKAIDGGISVDRMIEIVASLAPGITEVGCHPGVNEDTGSVYEGERALEVDILCDPRVREAIEREGVALRSFADV
jgi:chitin disaccharide deacetylase